MDPPKGFDTIKHDLLIAKLYAYGFNKESLMLLHSYFSNKWHRAKINKHLVHGKSRLKEWFKELISVLSPLFLNFSLNDLLCFAESSNVFNFAYNTTFYAWDKDLNPLVNIAW